MKTLTDVNDCRPQTEPQRILEGLDSALYAKGSSWATTAVVLVIAKSLMAGKATYNKEFGQVIVCAGVCITTVSC